MSATDKDEILALVKKAFSSEAPDFQNYYQVLLEKAALHNS